MKNAFYLTLKSPFVLKMFKFLSWHFNYVEGQLDYKYKVNFKIYDFSIWKVNNQNALIAEYL